ncbi:TPA: MFS transporter [Enterobacter cloacae]|uniref:MFS transporter n=2 Tax=Enterobacter TaxID=547 RepID=UPI0020055790|nr:MFS transporter [Enterobacter cloacae]MCK6804979.1 MFS transporter [Enterobacter cloacae]MCK6828340.1 MFS transporter [Enterobacter cloacae]MCM7170748.1 MFS transporter [Enterobacter cloacae]MDT0533888.1 MFS transporter [Enterobacter cloacae]UPW33115.1 MFS transporter [Enterobacter cloacae]
MTDLFSSGAFAIIAAWMMYFFTNFAGLTPIEGGSILFIAKIIDTFISPCVGYITDNIGNTRLGKRFGRRRLFLLAGAALVYVFSLLWIPGMPWIYYLFVYIAVEIIAALVIIPWETLASEMTDDYKQRSILSAIRLFYGGFSTWLATFLPGRLFAHFGTSDSKVFFINGVIFSIIFMFALLITWSTTWERKQGPSESVASASRFNLKSIFLDMASTLRIRCFRQHLTMYIFSFTSLDLFYTVFIYFVIYSLNGDAILASNLLAIGIFLTGWSNALMAWAVIRYGQTLCLKVCLIVSLVSFFIFGGLSLWRPVSIIPIMYATSLLYQFFKGGYVYIIWNIYPFIPDVDELVTRQRREGLFAGVMTLARKSTSALAGMFIGAVLQFVHFDPASSTQSLTTIHGITGLFFFGNILLLLVSTIIAFRFKLSKENHQRVKEEITRLKNGGHLDNTDPQIKKALYSLTGIEHEKLWP